MLYKKVYMTNAICDYTFLWLMHGSVDLYTDSYKINYYVGRIIFPGLLESQNSHSLPSFPVIIVLDHQLPSGAMCTPGGTC